MKEICFAYDRDGRLHADNPNHPGITESDLAEILSNLALIEIDRRNPAKRLATAPSSGKYDFLTVVYAETLKNVRAITAYPSKTPAKREFIRRLNEGGELWIPARGTEAP